MSVLSPNGIARGSCYRGRESVTARRDPLGNFMQTEPPPLTKRSPERPFVGRSHEHAAFDARLDDALRSDGSIVLLFGDPGIGKTSLLRSWLARARARSFAVASVANFPFAGDPYAPLAELGRTLARTDPRALPRATFRVLGCGPTWRIVPLHGRYARCVAVLADEAEAD